MKDETPAYPKAPSGKPVALEARDSDADGRRFSPSIARNRDAVRDAFLAHMPTVGTIFEIASGTGEHGAHIASACPELKWQYSDIDPVSLASQAAWVAHIGAAANLLSPVELDVTQPGWGNGLSASAPVGVFCANMIHIAPFAAAEGLITGAGQLLNAGGRLMLYGPFARDGIIAPSNASFSEDLKRRDPAWGVRDLDRDIVPLAQKAQLLLAHVIDMPANNLSVVFEKM